MVSASRRHAGARGRLQSAARSVSARRSAISRGKGGSSAAEPAARRGDAALDNGSDLLVRARSLEPRRIRLRQIHRQSHRSRAVVAGSDVKRPGGATPVKPARTTWRTRLLIVFLGLVFVYSAATAFRLYVRKYY